MAKIEFLMKKNGQNRILDAEKMAKIELHLVQYQMG